MLRLFPSYPRQDDCIVDGFIPTLAACITGWPSDSSVIEDLMQFFFPIKVYQYFLSLSLVLFYGWLWYHGVKEYA
jgi:hypothetical protein